MNVTFALLLITAIFVAMIWAALNEEGFGG